MNKLIVKRTANLFRQSRFAFSSTYPAAWEKLAKKELGDQPVQSLEWKSPEGITIKPLYTQHDLNKSVDVNHVDAPGVYPFKRGPYATMYSAKP